MPDYKGGPLDADRGPGLGCFWIQVVLLLGLLVLTPLSVVWAWPSMVSAALLILSLVLLFFVGQTMIFLLRLVAADRRSRRRPLRSDARRTVGQLENIRRFEGVEDVLRHGEQEHAKHHTAVQPKVGDRVTILRTSATAAAGFADRTGTVGGWTTPSVTEIKVIGNPRADHAHGVNFDDGTHAWFDPELVMPAPEAAASDEDHTASE
jgi:hypothetical protein